MRSLSNLLFLAGLVLLALALRLSHLESPIFWVDEAESSLNALTIVASGVPGDRLMGEPIYENTLVREWPEHPEYEFRDLSYSDKGYAVYHSWLPLYSIALAFRLAGVTPEMARRGPPLRDASQSELEHWTRVPRYPAVFFGALLVVAGWWLGYRVSGMPVAFALALGLATSDFFVSAGRQARYYSAAIALSTLAGLAVWNAWRRGRAIDHVLVGLGVGAVFHAHSVSAVAIAGLYVLAAPLGWRQPKLVWHVSLAGAVAALLILPWAVWTGMLSQAGYQPPARALIDWALVVGSLPKNPIVWLTLLVGFCWFAIAYFGDELLSERVRRPILDATPVIWFLLAWQVVSYLVYFLLMPAASFFPHRLKLMVAVPGLLLMTVFVAVVARLAGARAGFAPVLLALLLFAAEQLDLGTTRTPAPDVNMARLFHDIRSWPLAPGARIYATPNEHLVLTYYSGRLVQSVAPIRREWLERFDGDLIVLESLNYSGLRPRQTQELARRFGVALDLEQAAQRSRAAIGLTKALDLKAVGATVYPAPEVPTPLDLSLMMLVRERTLESVQSAVRGTPIERFGFATWDEYRHGFFYWFSHPERRRGADLNYHACRSTARVSIHISGYAVLDCRKRGDRLPMSDDVTVSRR